MLIRGGNVSKNGKKAAFGGTFGGGKVHEMSSIRGAKNLNFLLLIGVTGILGYFFVCISFFLLLFWGTQGCCCNGIAAYEKGK